MTGQDLFEGMNELDEALLDEALQVKTRRPAALRWGALAACMGLLVLGGLGAWRSGLFRAGDSHPAPEGEPLVNAVSVLPGEMAGVRPAAETTGTTSAVTTATGSDLMIVPVQGAAEQGPVNLPAQTPTEETPVNLPVQEPTGETPVFVAGEAVQTDTKTPEAEEGAETVMGPVLREGEEAPWVANPPIPMIAGYGDGSEACYKAPDNGEVCRSVPLRGAVEEYGDRAKYRVFVDLFRDGQPVPQDSEEAQQERERLASLGYIVATETVFENGERVGTFFTLHATREELEALDPGGYGYMLFLYHERVPGAEPSDQGTVVFNTAIEP